MCFREISDQSADSVSSLEEEGDDSLADTTSCTGDEGDVLVERRVGGRRDEDGDGRR